MTREAGPWEAPEGDEPSDAEKMAKATEDWSVFVESAAGMKAQLVAAGFTPGSAEQIVTESLIGGMVDNQAAARVTAANAELNVLHTRAPFWRRS